MTATTIHNIITRQSFEKGLVKVGTPIIICHGGQVVDGKLVRPDEVYTGKVTSLDGGSMHWEGTNEHGDKERDYYDIDYFLEFPEDEIQSSYAVFFAESVPLIGDLILLNIKRNTVVLVGTTEEVTSKVLALKQGGVKMEDLRIVPTSAVKPIKITLEL